MPTPIRPIGNSADSLINAPYDKEFEMNSIGIPQIIPGNYQPLEKESGKFEKTSPEDRKVLYHIWEDGGKSSQIQASVNSVLGVRSDRNSVQIPSYVNMSVVGNLITRGFLKDCGANTVAFTEKGKFALSKEIMSQPSTLDKKESR